MAARHQTVLGKPQYLRAQITRTTVRQQESVGKAKPSKGEELKNETLAQALEGKTLAALVAATRAGHHKRPRELDSSVPRDLDALADKALQVNPEERIESARAFVRELRLALSGEPLTIYSYSPLERATRFVRRHPGGVAAPRAPP